jgi:hypothetical protein
MDGLVDEVIWPADGQGCMHGGSAGQFELGLCWWARRRWEGSANQEAWLDEEVRPLQLRGQGGPWQLAARL